MSTRYKPLSSSSRGFESYLMHLSSIDLEQIWSGHKVPGPLFCPAFHWTFLYVYVQLQQAFLRHFRAPLFIRVFLTTQVDRAAPAFRGMNGDQIPRKDLNAKENSKKAEKGDKLLRDDFV
ncbi:hypothetical protein RRG08_004300 [Elysia crispata]|uniref:Uncharacterized protein n=1 Tax=Elysia crispata TaxID=231223 RepID=A0AAE1CW89_9GAST|nr:hypothetical protein RRG08_004300 [Elysia crispata]